MTPFESVINKNHCLCAFQNYTFSEKLNKNDYLKLDGEIVKWGFWRKLVHVPNFWGVAGSEDFAFATLPTTPLDLQGKISHFCHPTLLKIRFKITVTLPLKNGQSQNYDASINSNGLLTL